MSETLLQALTNSARDLDQFSYEAISKLVTHLTLSTEQLIGLIKVFLKRLKDPDSSVRCIASATLAKITNSLSLAFEYRYETAVFIESQISRDLIAERMHFHYTLYFGLKEEAIRKDDLLLQTGTREALNRLMTTNCTEIVMEYLPRGLTM